MWAKEQGLNISFSIWVYIFIRGWSFNECPHKRKAPKTLCASENFKIYNSI